MVVRRHACDSADAQLRSFVVTEGGTGSVIVVALTNGTYNVFRNGVRIADDIAVPGSDGTIALHDVAIAGEWVITSVPPVELGVDTASVTFTVAGAVPPPQRLIAQCSGGACTILVSADKPWIAVKPASGNDYVEVSVGVNPLGMRDGVYHGTVTVSAPGALGSPQQISVEMAITEQLRGGGRSSRARLRGRSLMR
jgi:hypothetical protein